MAQVGSLWLQRLAAISDLISFIGSVLGVIVVLGLFFVVGNTIKLAIESRKGEIKVIKLVGGTDMYAAKSFFIRRLPLWIWRRNLGYAASGHCFNYL